MSDKTTELKRRLLVLEEQSSAIRRELDRADEAFVPPHIDKAQAAADAEIEMLWEA